MEFITFFTKTNEIVLDPMAGTGSTLVAALRTGRSSYGIELNTAYANIARQVIAEEIQNLGNCATGLTCELFTGDAAQTTKIASSQCIPLVDYLFTSPPYWDMLHARGSETQKKRRSDENLDVFYSDDPNDLGNITEYEEFIDRLTHIYTGMQPIIRPGAYLTIIVKNIKKGGKIYPLAWDLARRLGDTYTLKDERIWCQDNQRLSPYGLGNAWVSNTFHHYCLQFRNE